MNEKLIKALHKYNYVVFPQIVDIIINSPCKISRILLWMKVVVVHTANFLN